MRDGMLTATAVIDAGTCLDRYFRSSSVSSSHQQARGDLMLGMLAGAQAVATSAHQETRDMLIERQSKQIKLEEGDDVQ